MPTNITPPTSLAESDVLKKFQKALGNDARYAKLKNHTKTPDGSFKPGKRNRYVRIPKGRSYGVIPQNKLFILDLDQHREDHWNLDKQLDFFSNLFGTEIRNSLAVITPSGGAHVYLKFPDIYTEQDISKLIPKGSLRGYNEAFSEIYKTEVRLDADIRSGFSNGYVVGPGNFVNSEQKTRYNRYFLANESFGFRNPAYEILTVNENSIDRIQQLSNTYKRLKTTSSLSNLQKKEKESSCSVQDAIETGFKPLQQNLNSFPSKEIIADLVVRDDDKSVLIHALPSPDVINMLRKTLSNKNVDTFHRARALIKASLHCCYDNYSIAMACIELGVDKDSYRKESLGFRHLVRDIGGFTPQKRYHNKYCYEGKKRLRNLQSKAEKKQEQIAKYSAFDVDAYRAFNKKKLEDKKHLPKVNNSRFAKPKVLDVSKISQDILGNSRKKKPSQQYKDAMNIINYYIQPLSNVGAIKILLAHSDISEQLGINSSRVSQAMRILRNNEIIRIEQKQRTGLAATYSVPEKYSHTFLSKALKLAWGKYNSQEFYDFPHPIYFNFANKRFETVFSNQKVEPVADFSSWTESMMNKLPEGLVIENYGSGAAERYLVAEKEALGYNSKEEDNSLSRENDVMDKDIITNDKYRDESNFTFTDNDSIIDLSTGEIINVQPMSKDEKTKEVKDNFDYFFNIIDENVDDLDLSFQKSNIKKTDYKSRRLSSQTFDENFV